MSVALSPRAALGLSLLRTLDHACRRGPSASVGGGSGLHCSRHGLWSPRALSTLTLVCGATLLRTLCSQRISSCLDPLADRVPFPCSGWAAPVPRPSVAVTSSCAPPVLSAAAPLLAARTLRCASWSYAHHVFCSIRRPSRRAELRIHLRDDQRHGCRVARCRCRVAVPKWNLLTRVLVDWSLIAALRPLGHPCWPLCGGPAAGAALCLHS